MKFLLFSDVQVHGDDPDYKAFSYSSHLSCVYASLKWVASKVASTSPNIVVCLGDVAHTHGYIEIPANNAAISGFKLIADECAKIDASLIIVSGNHDHDTADGRSSYIDALQFLDNVLVIKRPIRADFDVPLWFVPYRGDIDFDSVKGGIAFIHREIDGYPLAPGVFDQGMTSEQLSKWDYVFLGHYHAPISYRSYETVGALMCNDYNDDYLTSDNDKRGVMTFEYSAGLVSNVVRIRNPMSPRYITAHIPEDVMGAERDKTNIRIAFDMGDHTIDTGGFISTSIVSNAAEKDVSRSTIDINTTPVDAVVEYAKCKGMDDATMRYGVDLVSGAEIPTAATFVGTFKECSIQNFMGISRATFSYDTIGKCLIEGKNLTETCSSSRGSGKSSMFIEAMVWALWNTTVRGTKDVVNDSVGGNCMVSMKWSDGKHDYHVIRCKDHDGFKIGVGGKDVKISGSKVVFLEDGKDISKHKIPDTNNLIIEKLGLSWEAFCSLLIMGSPYQGKYVTFTSMGPFDRVQYLENFMRWLAVYPMAYDKALKRKSALLSEIQGLEARISGLNCEIERISSTIESATVKSKDWKSENDALAEKLKMEVEAAEEEVQRSSDSAMVFDGFVKVITGKIEKLPSPDPINTQILSATSRIGELTATVTSNRAIIGNVTALRCSQCGQDIGGEHRRRISESAGDTIKSCEKEIEGCRQTVRKLVSVLEEMRTTKSDIQRILGEYISKRDEFTNMIRVHKKEVEISRNQWNGVKDRVNPYDDMIAGLELTLTGVSKDRENATVEIDAKRTEVEVVTRWVEGFSPSGVRSFVLDRVLNRLNHKIGEICCGLFSGELGVLFSPEMVGGKTSIKVMVSFGDRTRSFESCSGGESGAVNLAVNLALRDFAQTVTGSVWNLAIFDEPVDAQDRKSPSYVIDTIKGAAPNVIVISHNESIKSMFDRKRTVVKEGGVIRLLED